MQRIMKATIFVLVFLTICVIATVSAKAQQGKDVLPAPLPSQVVNGRKIFIANAGAENALLYNGGPQRFYNQFYAAMKSWGHYELVGSPAEADLVFEISSRTSFLGVGSTSGRNITDPQLRLAIIDPATRITLWTFIEHIEPALLQSNRDKNFDHALNDLVNDFQSVAGQPVASANNKK